MTMPPSLVLRLADGQRHTVAELADELNLTPAGLDAQLRTLADWGLVVARVDDGLKLIAPLDLIDRLSLEQSLDAATRARLDRLEVHDAIDSTNARLLAEKAVPAGRARVLLAEYQHAGRRPARRLRHGQPPARPRLAAAI